VKDAPRGADVKVFLATLGLTILAPALVLAGEAFDLARDLMGTPCVALAQAVPPSSAIPGPPAQADSSRLGRRGDVDPRLRRRFEEVRRRRMAEYIGLNDQEAGELDRELREFRQQQGNLRQERERLLGELRRTLEERGPGGERPGDAAPTPERRTQLQQQLDALRRNTEARERSQRELQERLSQRLSIEQQARLQLFAERFHRQLSDGISRLRDRREGWGRDRDQRPRGPGFRQRRPTR
jgi:hypothetical protein